MPGHRQRHELGLLGAAVQEQRRAGPAAQGGRLVHDPGRGADELVLRPLRQPRHRRPVQIQSEQVVQGHDRGDLHGVRGGQARAHGDGRVQQQLEPGHLHPVEAGEHVHHAGRVRPPAADRPGGEPGDPEPGPGQSPAVGGVRGGQVDDVVPDRVLALPGPPPLLRVPAQPDGDHRRAVDGEGQHEAVVVVGVLPDEVHPSRGTPHPVRSVAVHLGEAAGELIRPGGVVLACLPSGRLGGVLSGHRAASLRRAAVCSAVTSLMNAPMAASEPARNFSLSSARRGLVSCRCNQPASRSAVVTGVWCQAAM